MTETPMNRPMVASAIVIVGEDGMFLELVDFCLSTHGDRTIHCPYHDLSQVLVGTIAPALFIIDLDRDRNGKGWQTLCQLRLDPSTANIPMIVCSIDAGFLKEQAEELKLMSAEVLAKPFGVSELLMLDRYRAPPYAAALKEAVTYRRHGVIVNPDAQFWAVGGQVPWLDDPA